MSTPRYVAVKSGDNYEIRRVDAEYRVNAATCIAAGMLMGAVGLSRRSFPGLLLLAGGVGVSYYGWTGKNPLKAIGNKVCTQCVPEGSASYQHDTLSHATQRPENAVDEAAMESFPASDPPAHHVAT